MIYLKKYLFFVNWLNQDRHFSYYSRTSSKTKTSTSRTSKAEVPPFGVFHSDFFGTMRLFLQFFGFHQRVSPRFFDILQHKGRHKFSKGPPFTFFGTVILFKNLIKINFLEFFLNLPRTPFNCFHILQPTGVS